MQFKPLNNSVSGIEKGDFYCYEIKSSVEDFHSKNGHNLIGDYNYYVMLPEVYEKVKDEIPWKAGVYVPDGQYLKSVKNAKRTDRTRSAAEMLLMMFRSAARDRKLTKLADYEDTEESGTILKVPPCRVGDAAYVIDKDSRTGEFSVFAGKWDIVSFRASENWEIEVHGRVSYEIPDIFTDSNKTTPTCMYVGQKNTKFGEVVFLTPEEAEQARQAMTDNKVRKNDGSTSPYDIIKEGDYHGMDNMPFVIKHSKTWNTLVIGRKNNE
jgi:hypothetical protein